MQKVLALLFAGMIPAMISATDFTLKPTSPWKKTADDAAAIDYDGRKKVWPHLWLKTAEPLKPDTFYRITFDAKSSAPERAYCGFHAVIQGEKMRMYTIFFPAAEFRKYAFYFNSGEKPETGTANIYFDPTNAFQMEVKNLRLDEMTGESLFGKNLLPCGNFEEGNPFHSYKKELKDHLKIAEPSDFLSGEKSLLLDCRNGRVEIISDGLPALPGKEIEVKFYAKSADAAQIHVTLDFGKGSSGKHYYRSARFRVEKEWKECSCKFKISEDLKTYPVLARHLANLRFGGMAAAGDGNAQIYLDGISYAILKDPAPQEGASK